MDPQELDRTAARAGIKLKYTDAWGQEKTLGAETKQQLLAAMAGLAKDNDRNGPLPPVWVLRGTDSPRLTLAKAVNGHWTLIEEAGRRHQGQVKGSALTLPSGLPDGYHQLVLIQEGQQWECQLIRAPGRCYEPPEVAAGGKLWGCCIQLYTLRSERNWGIGDFGDLALLIEGTGKHQGAFVGLNPIHALYPALPQWASPYSPSSRHWLNVIYIDVGAVDDFVQSQQAQRWWSMPETKSRLAELRQSALVDYPGVMAFKLTALNHAWNQFRQRTDDCSQVAAFRAFVQAGGEKLRLQALFDALHEYLNDRQEETLERWQQWPSAYQDPDGEAVNDFCRRYPERIAFYQWLQWLASRQFDACFRLSRRLDMPIGIYRDLAVGVGEGGVETWSDRELYCLTASVGAPPDRLGPQGQNWGLPPQDPNVLIKRAYGPFIDMLRANMRHCGALRIDHVMSLLRLWWIPGHRDAGQGAYVEYPLQDLLGVLALESQRQRCMVIGEDLGTVPPEITGQLQEAGIYSYKVLFFERDKDGCFHTPDSYLLQAMATLTTHDLATLRGFWLSEDLKLGQRLGLYPSEETFPSLLNDRRQDIQALLDQLIGSRCLDADAGMRADELDWSPELNLALHRYIALSRSTLLGLQPEDWLEMSQPVNVPGTTDEYPNWRRKLSRKIEEIFADEQVAKLLTAVNHCRQQAADNARKR